MAGLHDATDSCALCTRLVDAVAPAAACGHLRFSMEHLATVAGIDPGLAEDHVGSDIEPLVAEAYERESHAVMDCCEYGFVGAQSWEDGLRAGVRDELLLFVERPAALRLLVLVVEDGRRPFLEVRDRLAARAVDIFARHHARLRPEAEPLSTLQVELLAGALRHEIRGMIVDGALTGPLDELVERVIRSVRVFEATDA